MGLEIGDLDWKGRMTQILACLIIFVSATASAQTQDPLAPLQFLLGDWRAIETEAGESGGFTFKRAVQDRVIVRTNHAVYAANAQRSASRHDDLMIIYSENASLKADYFDSEGHVIRYVVRPQGARSVVFTSDSVPREPRYRLTYTAAPDGVLNGSFEIAAPGDGNFKPYLSWKAAKR